MGADGRAMSAWCDINRDGALDDIFPVRFSCNAPGEGGRVPARWSRLVACPSVIARP